MRRDFRHVVSRRLTEGPARPAGKYHPEIRELGPLVPFSGVNAVRGRRVAAAYLLNKQFSIVGTTKRVKSAQQARCGARDTPCVRSWRWSGGNTQLLTHVLKISVFINMKDVSVFCGRQADRGGSFSPSLTCWTVSRAPGHGELISKQIKCYRQSWLFLRDIHSHGEILPHFKRVR